MLGFDKLAGNARRFKMLVGMSLQEFDLLFVKVEKMYPEEERKRLSKRSRQREIGAGRKFVLSVRERILLLLFYYRTYATQDVAAEVFGVGQSTVSRSIEQIAPVVKKCVPIPAKLYARSKRVSTVEELEELFPGLVALVDASEQSIQRPKRKDMEKSHYSGKAGRHTAKTQYTVNVHGLIIHNTRLSPGCVHDFKVYKTKYLTFPKNLPSRDGFGQGGKAREPAELWRPWVSGSAEGRPGRGGGAANQVQAWQKALPRREGDQQATVQDSGPCGKCDPPDQNPPDHGGQIPKSAEKVRPHQRYRMRTCQPEGALEGGSSDLTGRPGKSG